MKIKGVNTPQQNRTSPLNEWVQLGDCFINAKGNKFGGWIDIEVPYGSKAVSLYVNATKTTTGNFKLSLGCPGPKALDQELITETQLRTLYDFNRKQ
jgi:hypothetical protein